VRGDPDVSFAILKQAGDAVARQPVVLRKLIDPPVVYVRETAAERAEPQRAVAAAQHLHNGRQLAARARQPVHLAQRSVYHPVEPARQQDEEDAVGVFTQGLNELVLRQRIEARLALVPLPHAVRLAEPDLPVAILVDGRAARAEAAVLSPA